MTWETVRVGDIAQQIRGVTYIKDEASSTPLHGHVAILRAGNIGDAGLVLDDLVHVPAARVSDSQLLRPNDVVVATSSGSLSVVGKAARVLDPMDASFGAFCKVLRPVRHIDPAYFAHFFRTPGYRRYISSVAAGANINNLRSDDLDRIEIPLPPLAEQRRIAAILDEADRLRTVSNQQSLHLQLHDEAAFERAAAADGAGRVMTVGDLLLSTQYGTSAKAGSEGEFPVLRMGNISSHGQIDLSDMKYIDIAEKDREKFLVHTGDLLFNRTNSVDLVGKTAVYREESPRAFAGYLVRARPKSRVLGEYMAGYLNSRRGKQELRRMAKSIVGMANINARELRTMRIVVPDQHVLERYANELSASRRISEAVRSRRTDLDHLFASLQYRAFRGEL